MILEELKAIEETYDVKIIYACEAGSRAWGFASEDSDFDVRFIYVRHLKDYLSLTPIDDVIKWKLDDVMDINGWDLKKACLLGRQSNPSLYEWLNSPIVYQESDESLALKAFFKDTYSLNTLYHHYLHMGKSQHQMIVRQPDIKVKRYLYVLRSLFAAMWIVEKHEYPPIAFSELMTLADDQAISLSVSQILSVKSGNSEGLTIPEHQLLDQYIKQQLALLETHSHQLPHIKCDDDQLDHLFRQIVKGE